MDYLNFEKRMTNELTVMFRRAEDPVTKEMARLQTLRTREWCRDYWVAMNREVPARIGFSKEGRMNKHIEVVKKWLADNDSVSQTELEYNHVSAYNAYINDAAADAAAAVAAAEAAEAAADAAANWGDKTAAAHWVKKYEELSNG